ncbi:MAG: hypothetical protein PHD18_12280, partial [Tolumonas sp.]|nr:hypothetical protein [Tolumonas sp.]
QRLEDMYTLPVQINSHRLIRLFHALVTVPYMTGIARFGNFMTRVIAMTLKEMLIVLSQKQSHSRRYSG